MHLGALYHSYEETKMQQGAFSVQNASTNRETTPIVTGRIDQLQLDRTDCNWREPVTTGRKPVTTQTDPVATGCELAATIISWEYGMSYILQHRSAWYEPCGEEMASPQGSYFSA
jgi:hypothetical protein